MITVYTMPNCGPCMSTKHALRAKGIPFTEVDLSTDPAAQARVAEWGYRKAPIVETPQGHWQDFRPDLIAGLLSP